MLSKENNVALPKAIYKLFGETTNIHEKLESNYMLICVLLTLSVKEFLEREDQCMQRELGRCLRSEGS